ncbi:myeloid cell surface antigen CD33-like, partial [Plectropomus leopardus]|uniref:myeloid cell surface antigen CD33-like n=1 Tax=Plectropomus leopardus TaxID=160734 RepID=UPI001C4B391D
MSRLQSALAACSEVSALFITTPEQMEALSGSCLQIPCNFSAATDRQEKFDGTRATFGVWHQNEAVVFNSSKKDNSYPIQITGNLRQNNCTTLFSSLSTDHRGTYSFRIENRPFLATAVCDPLQIIVEDVPPRPKIKISGDLKENEFVTITCSASTPCPHSPPKLTWTLTQDPHNTTEENKDRTLTTKIKTTIILSDQHDGVNFSCSASYPVEGGNYKTAEEELTLSVSYAPKDTSVSISPPGLVSA